MILRAVFGTLVVCGLFAATALQAQSLKDKKDILKADEQLAKGQEKMKTKCGKDIKAKMDWASFTGQIDEHGNSRARAVNYCIGAMDALADVCGDATGKAEVTKKVSTVDCKFKADAQEKAGTGDDAKKAPNCVLSGSNVSFQYNWKTPSSYNSVNSYKKCLESVL